MSLLREAYKLCKEVKQAPARAAFQDLTRRLSQRPEGDGTQDRSRFGYFARNQRAQVLGYLMLNQERQRLEKEPMPIVVPALSEAECQFFDDVHSEFIRINEACTGFLVHELPNCRQGINPYSQFNYLSSLDKPERSLLADSSVSAVSKNFCQIPAALQAIASKTSFTESWPEEETTRAVIGLIDMIDNQTADLDQLILTHTKGSLARTNARHLLSLATIRTSLGILNQLVYQALLQDSLPILDRDNIIDFGTSSEGLYENSISLAYTPTTKMRIVEPGNLVLLKSEGMLDDKTELCSAGSVTFEFSQEFGETIELDLRAIDENLNIYGTLLERL